MTTMEFSIAHYQDGLTHVTVYPTRAAAIEARHGEFAGRIAILGQRPAGSREAWQPLSMDSHIADHTRCTNCGHDAAWHDFDINTCHTWHDNPAACECCLYQPEPAATP